MAVALQPQPHPSSRTRRTSGSERPPRRVAGVTLPVRELGRVRELEHDGPLAGSIITGTSVPSPIRLVASARTQRDSTDVFDHSTTTALASCSASSVTWS